MQKQAVLSENVASDRWISLAVCFQVLLIGAKNMLVQAFEALYLQNNLLNAILFVIVGLTYVLAYMTLGSRMISFSPLSLAFVAFVVISFAASALIHPYALPQYGEVLGYFLPFCFLTVFMITRLTTLKWIAYYMERFSYLIIAVAWVCVIGILNTGHITTSDWSTYSMSLSNVIMVAVIWLLYSYFENHKLLALVGAALGILAILLCGSRNPLLAIVAYVVVKTVTKVASSKTPNRERWTYVLWSALLILFFLLFEPIIELAHIVLSALGIYSRSIGLLDTNLFFDSGRSVIHADLLAVLNQSPILGLGIGGDMASIGWPAHNFYLSVLSIYGYLAGTAILITFAVLLVKAFCRSRGRIREILLIYTCLFLPRNFTGNDILRSDIPWWLLGLVIVILSNPEKAVAEPELL
ncbi:MAG: hypothetical protein IJY22_02945 [Clostridia bacterium]|nr:hypothetical protein [Clostridia bacterium]